MTSLPTSIVETFCQIYVDLFSYEIYLASFLNLDESALNQTDYFLFLVEIEKYLFKSRNLFYSVKHVRSDI